MASTDPPPTIILLVDSHDKDRTYYTDRLKNSLPDCVILEARDGQTGLDLYHSRRVDCIVTELQLPDMSGFELLVNVVPRASYPTVAVVVLTHSSTPGLSDLAKKNGAQALLVKRLTAGDELARVIEKAIACVGPTHKDSRGS
jgi:DNA-binding NarL/FixJ family response regulator